MFVQQRLQALLEAAGINTRGVDGALLSNPSVLDHLSSSVNKALMDAKRAMNNVNLDTDIPGTCLHLFLFSVTLAY